MCNSSSEHTCLWWPCFTFDNPVRRRRHNPEQILGGLIQAGRTAADIFHFVKAAE